MFILLDAEKPLTKLTAHFDKSPGAIRDARDIPPNERHNLQQAYIPHQTKSRDIQTFPLK